MGDKNIVKIFYERNDKNEAEKGIIQLGIMGKLYHIFENFSIGKDEIVLSLVKKYNTGNIKKVFEVGVARGDFLIKLSQKINGIKKYYGVDISDNRIQDAKKNLDKYGLINELKCANIDEGLHYKDHTFDLISCLAVLEHVFDPINVIEEFSRVMRKDGLLVIEVPNIVVFFRRIAFLLGIRPRTSWDLGWDGGHLQYFTVNDLKKLLREKGFEILEVSGSGVFAKLRNWWVSMLSADIVIVAKKK